VFRLGNTKSLRGLMFVNMLQQPEENVQRFGEMSESQNEILVVISEFLQK